MIRALAVAAAVALVALPAAGGAGSSDYASTALNVLPPGQSGDLLFPPTATDQLKLYDGLTPRGGNVRAADLTTAQQKFVYQFRRPGVFPYHCFFHGGAGGKGMAGVVTVVERTP